MPNRTSRILTSLTCLLLSLPALAESPNSIDGMNAFPALKTMELKDIGVTLHYSSDKSQVLTVPHPDAKDLNEGGIYIARPLRVQLLGENKSSFIIDCDSGGSADPSCSVLQEAGSQLKKLLTIFGVRFAFPGNGSIYVDGHSNTMFNARRKFEWRNGSFVETPQPFRYVGLDTTTRTAITLYAKTDYKQPVASLPQDTAVTVLLNDGTAYLLKTPFGLVGWIRIAEGVIQENSPINGIYYAGD